MNQPEAPGRSGPSSPLKQHLDRLVALAKTGAPILGERLLVLGEGPVPVRGSLGGAVGLDRDGALVLIVAVPNLNEQTAAEIADQVDRLSQMSEAELGELETDPTPNADVRAKHRAMFKEEGGEDPRLNASQRVKLLVSARPPAPAWRPAVIELGAHLHSIHLATESGTEELEPPPEIRRGPAPAGGWSLWQWAGLAGLLLGVAIVSLAVWRAFAPPAPAIQVVQVRSGVQDVALEVPGDATNANWIAQKRVLKMSDGAMLALFRSPEGLNIVQDQRNHGRTWRSPSTIAALQPDSFSAAADDQDRVHIAYTADNEVRYAVLDRAAAAWEVLSDLTLDGRAEAVVDIAWDPNSQRAQVVWAQDADGDQQPQWASVSIDGGEAAVAQEDPLAAPGSDIPVLANITASDREVIVSYRRGDSPSGWFSRAATWTGDEHDWGSEQRIPIDANFGAASLVHSGLVTHLVLRDDDQNSLVYLRRRAGAAWSSPQTAIQGEAIEDVDFPVLSVDGSSGLVYLFFQSDAFQPAPQIEMVVRDPVAGWEGPYQTAEAQSIPEGARNPVALSVTEGQPVVIWTRAGPSSAVQAARVSLP